MSAVEKVTKHKWSYENVGGACRVRIATGEDIAHLEELDPKMWTVLSCPVKGLEIDEKSLSCIDRDSDGKIRVGDVVATAKWMSSVLRDPGDILRGEDTVCVDQLSDSQQGETLKASIGQVLANLGKEGGRISLVDTADPAAIFAKTRFNGDAVITEASAQDAEDKAAIAAILATLGGVPDRSGEAGVDAAKVEAFYKAIADFEAWSSAAVEPPFGDSTQQVIDAYEALDAKVRDFFLRSRLAAFSPESSATLDVRPDRIEAISSDNLTARTEEIASYPLARVTGAGEIDLAAPFNPVWAERFEVLRKTVFGPEAESLSEEQWDAAGARFNEYLAWRSAKAGSEVEALGVETVRTLLAQDRKESLLALIAKDASFKEEADNIDLVDKFLHIYRDFARLLRNFVTFNDFYSKNPDVKAIFQSGRLIVDQRECHLCLRVLDEGKHNATAAVSGMFLVYCDCSAKSGAAKDKVVAAMTVGEVGDIFVGKNVIYYDNSGAEWDAVITKIVENPISVGQAFWSPYRRMAKAIENLIGKSAADKDAKMMSGATEKINAMPASVPTDPADKKTAAVAPPFDIAKFAGIFAALGMALGMIGTALAALAKGIFALTWWQLLLAFLGLALLISGPAMVLAWLKLRRRNIAPLLNANGWAVNAVSRISIPFGESLTERASFPKMRLRDPYAKGGIAPWLGWLIGALIILLVASGLWLSNVLAPLGLRSPLPCFGDAEAAPQEIVQEPASEDPASDGVAAGESQATDAVVVEPLATEPLVIK